MGGTAAGRSISSLEKMASQSTCQINKIFNTPALDVSQSKRTWEFYVSILFQRTWQCEQMYIQINADCSPPPPFLGCTVSKFGEQGVTKRCHLSWLTSYMSPNAWGGWGGGGGWGCKVSANEYSCAYGAQINFIFNLCLRGTPLCRAS